MNVFVFGNALFFFRKKENYAHFVRVFSNKFENRRKEKKVNLRINLNFYQQNEDICI